MDHRDNLLSSPSWCGMQHTVLLCPKDLTGVTLYCDGALSCESGHRYPVIDGLPVLLRDDIEQTMDLAAQSMSRARGEPRSIDRRNPDLYLESLGISEAEKNMASARESRMLAGQAPEAPTERR